MQSDQFIALCHGLQMPGSKLEHSKGILFPLSQHRGLVLPLDWSETLVSHVLFCFPVDYYGRLNVALVILFSARSIVFGDIWHLSLV